MKRRYVPERGDLVWLDFEPRAGHEQDGRRPALALSPRYYNQKTGLGIFCPITSQAKGFPFEVALPGGFKIIGAVLADHLKSMDWRMRKAKHIDRAPPEVIAEVLQKIAVLFGVDSWD